VANNLDMKYCVTISKQVLDIIRQLKLHLNLPKSTLEVNENLSVGWMPSFHMQLNDI
jgi:hypothetical protein